MNPLPKKRVFTTQFDVRFGDVRTVHFAEHVVRKNAYTRMDIDMVHLAAQHYRVLAGPARSVFGKHIL